MTWYGDAFENHFCRGKEMSITYLSMCACVRVGASVCMYPCLYSMQRICSIFWRDLYLFWLYHHIFRHYLINGTILGKNVFEHKMRVSNLWTLLRSHNISSFPLAQKVKINSFINSWTQYEKLEAKLSPRKIWKQSGKWRYISTHS